MSVRLAKMLGKSEAEVAEFIEQMEDKNGFPSHDIRLLSETNQAARNKITDLGLDPQDTSVEELYQALQAKFAADATLIDKAMGLKIGDGFDTRMARAIEIAKHIVGDVQVWTLKPASAKKMLLNSSPKKLMKQLHYRTLDSMLKREDIGELFLLAPFVESSSWQNVMAREVARLASSGYGLNSVNIVHINASKCDNLAKPTNLNICNKLTGSLSLWPSEKLTDVPVITMVMMLLQSAQEIGVTINSRALAQVNPALHWWLSIEHLISSHQDKPVSLNIGDVAHNHLNRLNYKDGVTHHGAKALWSELLMRYQSLGDDIEDEVGKLMPAQLAAQLQEA